MNILKRTILSIMLISASSLLSTEDEYHVPPYILSANSPLKLRLDSFFDAKKPTKDKNALLTAGFQPLEGKTKKGHPVVAKHPSYPDLIFKIHLDNQPIKHRLTATHLLVMRIRGANKIQALIQEKKWTDQFSVPTKWIYFANPQSILVEEEMELLDEAEPWKSSRVTKELLDSLYFILKELGLRDCAKPANIPFTKEGKIAFVDTQTWGEWPVSYHRLSTHLTPQMRKYWEEITNQSKPTKGGYNP